jgi:processive 1,2-diacylglycerol beta-glucosyltransferase
MKRPILILTTAFGEGHNAAARNLATALKAADPERAVEVRDLFTEAYGPVYLLAQKAYFLVINHFPGLWGAFYKYLDTDKKAPGRVAIYKRAARLLAKTFSEKNPAVIASTYPGYNHLLDHLHGTVDRPFRTVTVVTDSITINSLWYSGHSDLFLVPNEVTSEVMQGAGVPVDKLRVTGFPVPEIFGMLRGKRPLPGEGHPPKVLYLANPGQKNAVKILEQLGAIEGIELSAACGRDEDLRGRMQAAADKLPHPFRVEGWMKDLPERIAASHLIVAKAGGATVQECLAAGTPLVMSQIIPGQEEGNALLLNRSESGCAATSPLEIAASVRSAFARGAVVWKTWEANAMKTGLPEGARNSALAVLEEAGKQGSTGDSF